MGIINFNMIDSKMRKVYIILSIITIAICSCKTESSQEKDINQSPESTTNVYSDKDSQTASTQYMSRTISERINGKKHTHSFVVDNGKFTWIYRGADGNESRTYDCNPDVPAKIIIAEGEAMAYWSLASECFNEMIDEVGMYSNDLHQKGKSMISKCATNLKKARQYCPGAYKKAQDHYKNLIDAEGVGADALWEEIQLLAYGLEEHPLDVCDIYFDD